ncbi:MAG: stage III sporulation protein AB [Oscillospiraceae bacterium]
MNYIKALGILSIFLSCVILGGMSAYKLGTRVKALKAASVLVTQIITTLQYTLSSPIEIFEALGRTAGLECDYIEKTIFEYENSADFKSAFSKALKSSCSVNSKDINLIKELGNVLGCFDKDTQLERLKLLKGEIDQVTGKLNENLLQRDKLYITSGVSLGCIFSIILF